jgi:hypothetical protein
MMDKEQKWDMAVRVMLLFAAMYFMGHFIHALAVSGI